jgi:hypothetical protein
MTSRRFLIIVFLPALAVISWYFWTSSPSHWLKAEIKQYDAQQVWKFQHKGEPAYFIQSGCCDQYDPVFSASGKYICSPSGGFEGSGDGKCPWPADPGTKITLVWPDIKLNDAIVAPQLSKP